MGPDALHRLKRTILAALEVIGIGAVAVIVPLLMPTASTPLEGYVARQPAHDQWVVIDEQDVMSGATVPQDVNIVFHVPLTVTKISREILLGLRGKDVRYWGYCYPENDTPETVDRRTGLKGLLFLSEKERAVRAEKERANTPAFTIANLPTKDDLAEAQTRHVTVFRHQIDFFKGGQMCYLMSEAPLPIGIDDDGDRLNNRLEKDLGTDPLLEDTDGDGILDGIEAKNGTSPTLRDSDFDGIIDGIEDTNWNGVVDKGETDPRMIDTDRDQLCDGECRKKLSNGQTLNTGEDRNFNGVVDDGETDPRLQDTDGDGTHDFQQYLACLTKGVRACQ